MAHEYTATVRWQRGPDEAFIDNKYSRGHTWGVGADTFLSKSLEQWDGVYVEALG